MICRKCKNYLNGKCSVGRNEKVSCSSYRKCKSEWANNGLGKIHNNKNWIKV